MALSRFTGRAVAVILFLGPLSFESHAASATATASATIVTPITVTVLQNLLFGNIAAGTGGTVVISTAGARSKTGGVTLVSTGSTQNQAIFRVNGANNATYAITLPASSTVASGANNMTINAFTSNPAGTGTLSATGTQNVNVGATLTVASAQAAGAYTGSFSVTVDYN